MVPWCVLGGKVNVYKNRKRETTSLPEVIITWSEKVTSILTAVASETWWDSLVWGDTIIKDSNDYK